VVKGLLPGHGYAQEDAPGRRRAHAVERFEPADVDVTLAANVVDIEQSVSQVVGVEGHREHSSESSAQHLVPDVQERLIEHPALVDDPDQSGALDHVQAAGDT
jgi:hypothetical protein